MANLNPWEFLESWCRENVHATAYEDKPESKRLAFVCRKAAKAAGVSEFGVFKAAGGDLEGFMLMQLNEAAGKEVDRLVEADRH